MWFGVVTWLVTSLVAHLLCAIYCVATALLLLIRMLAATVRVPNVTTSEVGNGYGREFRHCILLSPTLALLTVLWW